MTEVKPGEYVGARVVIEVLAGLVPNQAMPEYTRRYGITSAEWEAADGDVDPQAQGVLLAERNGRAQGYAAMLMLQPDRLNWVRVDWLWL